MKRLALLLTLLSTAVRADWGAPAQYSAETRALWKQVIGTEQPVLPTLHPEMYQWIAMPAGLSPEAAGNCRKLAREISRALTARVAYYASPLEDLTPNEASWRVLLRENLQAGTCQNYLAKTYLFGSLALNLSYAHVDVVQDKQTGLKVGLAELFAKRYIDQAPKTVAPLLLALAMLNQDRVRFLDPAARKQVADTHGPVWTQRRDRASPTRNEHRILGGYFCEDSRIWIDPDLSPHDLAATFLHELDHWMRDRADAEISADAKTQALFDEFAATTVSAVRQVSSYVIWSMHMTAQGLNPRPVAQVCSDPTLAKRDDLTWFGKGGSVCSLWNDLGDPNRIDLGSDGALIVHSMSQPRSPTSPVDRILQVVAKAYFPKRDQAKLASSVQWKRDGLESQLPFSVWLASYGDFFNLELRPKSASRWAHADHWDMGSNPFPITRGLTPSQYRAAFGISFRLRDLLQDLAKRVEKSPAPSASCQRSIRAWQNGELDDYLGSGKRKLGESGAGGRPGESGAGGRPGESGAGGRPGESGAGGRPGESGAGGRPTTGGISRPCSPLDFLL